MNVGDAQINAAGSASQLSLRVSGALSAGTGARLVANVSAGSVSNSAGGAIFGGTVTTAGGDIRIGDASLAGALTSQTGVIAIGNRTDIAGAITTEGAISVGDASRVNASVTGTGTGAVTIGARSTVSGVIRTGGAVTVGADSHAVDVISTRGAVTIGPGAVLSGAVSGHGAVTLGANANVKGPVHSDGAVTVGSEGQVDGSVSGYGAVTISAGAIISGSVSSTTGAISLGQGASVASVCCGTACDNSCATRSDGGALPPASGSGPHHVEIHHASGSGLTCSASTLNVVACADAACSSTYSGGLSGTLTGSGAGMAVNWTGGATFAIPEGRSSASVDVQVTTLGSVVLGMTGLMPAAAHPVSCNFGSPACSFSVADAGFLIAVPDHAADAAQGINVRAVRKSDQAALCVPAFTNISKLVRFSCGYANPARGGLPVRVAGVALNAANSLDAACDANGASLDLAFDADGVARTTLQYADAGQVLLTALYTGPGMGSAADAGLRMSGTTGFIAAPGAISFSAVPTTTLVAGAAFSATVTAVNSSASATPNFGQESPPQTVMLAFVRTQPQGPGASDGSFSGGPGAFSGGTATASNLVWSEVGRGDLSASLGATGYLGSGLNASGTTAGAAQPSGSGALGRFTPHHFDTAVTPACGSFTYAGQPFTLRVTALNALTPPAPTVNYDGSAATAPNFARSVSFSDAPVLGLGSFGASNALDAAQFRAGVASSTAAYSFTSKLTAPQTLTLRAGDADAVSSAGHVEGVTLLRSGRLRLSNAFGSERVPLALPVQAQYWSGRAWVINSVDYCSVLAAAAVSLSGHLDSRGAPTSAWSTSAAGFTLTGGHATLTLAPPSPRHAQSAFQNAPGGAPGSTPRTAPQGTPPASITGSIDVALNLGGMALDQSCLSAHAPSLGAALPWLRSQNGACSTGWDRDPSARASFGIFNPESQKTQHVRDLE